MIALTIHYSFRMVELASELVRLLVDVLKNKSLLLNRSLEFNIFMGIDIEHSGV